MSAPPGGSSRPAGYARRRVMPCPRHSRPGSCAAAPAGNVPGVGVFQPLGVPAGDRRPLTCEISQNSGLFSGLSEIAGRRLYKCRNSSAPK
nr:MAG TPA: hypothetical protein [Caudoviricetes sp.]